MKRSRWPRPSAALVVACLALFVALGGTVPAAKTVRKRRINGRAIRARSLPGNRLKVGSVPGNRLKKGTVPGNRLKSGTIPGNRIAPRSLQGAQIDVGTLGRVPSAAHADSADLARHARTATAADHAADATTVNGHPVGCAPGRREFAGACWDLQASPATATAIEAAAACGAKGGELPDLLALVAFARQPGVHLSGEGEWTNEVSPVSNTTYDILSLRESGEVHVGPPTERLHFRCVTPFLG